MKVVGLHAAGYILSMEMLHFHLSRDVLLTLVLEALMGGVLWALNQLVLKIRAWFFGISLMRSDMQRLRVQVMELRAEVVRSSIMLPPAPNPARDSFVPYAPIVIPPSLPTINVTSEDFVEGWEDDEDKTSSRS